MVQVPESADNDVPSSFVSDARQEQQREKVESALSELQQQQQQQKERRRKDNSDCSTANHDPNYSSTRKRQLPVNGSPQIQTTDVTVVSAAPSTCDDSHTINADTAAKPITEYGNGPRIPRFSALNGVTALSPSQQEHAQFAQTQLHAYPQEQSDTNNSSSLLPAKADITNNEGTQLQSVFSSVDTSGQTLSANSNANASITVDASAHQLPTLPPNINPGIPPDPANMLTGQWIVPPGANDNSHVALQQTNSSYPPLQTLPMVSSLNNQGGAQNLAHPAMLPVNNTNPEYLHRSATVAAGNGSTINNTNQQHPLFVPNVPYIPGNSIQQVQGLANVAHPLWFNPVSPYASQSMAMGNMNAGLLQQQPEAVQVAAAAPTSIGSLPLQGLYTSSLNNGFPPTAFGNTTNQSNAKTPVTLYLQCDHERLSDYQILVRQQLEVHEAAQGDVEANAQGRKKQVYLGQVGLRCRHCSLLPVRRRGKGCLYFPLQLRGLYQAAQNMARAHLKQSCPCIDPMLRAELEMLGQLKDKAIGGKQYWADAGKALGMHETTEGIRMANAGGPGNVRNQNTTGG